MRGAVHSENFVLRCSGRPTLVSVMESPDLGERDDLSEALVVHRSRLGRILLKRKMRP